MATIRRIKLHISLAGALIGAVLLSNVLLASVSYGILRDAFRIDLVQHLTELSGTVAMMIDPLKHRALALPADMKSADYLALRAKLKAERQLSPGIHFLYTFRMPPGAQRPRFVLDTGTEGVDFSPLGEEYATMTPALRASFIPPYAIHVERQPYTDKFGTFQSVYAPILMPDGSLEGVLGMDMDVSKIDERNTRLLQIVVGVTLLVVLIMGVPAWLFARHISRPLLILSRDMDRIRAFQLDGETDIHTRVSEVATMKNALDNMKSGLRSFKKYVPSDLVADLISLGKEATLGTEKHEVTIFFSDLENFTTASEQLSSEDLSRMLAGYFETVTGTLEKYGATVDKFVGDAVMAFWNAPRATGDHAYMGAKAALEVRANLEILMRQWQVEGFPLLQTRIGLATGSVMVGNVGYAERLSYTALGDAVNLASRLESLNKFYGTRILASQDTLRSVDGRLAYRIIDKVAVKGRTAGTLVGELAQVAPPWWDKFEAGWIAYQEADWYVALGHFTGLPDDGPSRVLATRCRRFLDQGVPADWTGTWVMQDK